MTSQIVVINQNRTFAITESNLTLDEFKTYVGEEKIFEISQNLSAVALVSGSGRFDSQKIKNHIVRYLAKTDIDKIKSVLEIKNTLNECIVKSTRKSNPNRYIKSTFPKFERKIKRLSKQFNHDELVNFLTINSFDGEIDILSENKILNSLLTKLNLSVFHNEYDELKSCLKRCYYDYLVRSSTNLVIVGYDEDCENPSYVKYAILFNNQGHLETVDLYSVFNCKSTMIFTIAQDEDINLNLTGFNDQSLRSVQQIIFELLDEMINNCDEKLLNSINDKLEDKIYELRLKNLEPIIDYIEFLPDCEILNLLDVLIQLTSIKKKFSKQHHSVGGRRVKAILRKYDGVKFID